MTKPSFSFNIEIDVTLDIEHIWPDGDAPEDPTVDDVRRVFYGNDEGKPKSRYDVRRACDDWSLLDVEELDVRISKNTPPPPPCEECRGVFSHRLSCSKRPPRKDPRCEFCGMITPPEAVGRLHNLGCSELGPKIKPLEEPKP